MLWIENDLVWFLGQNTIQKIEELKIFFNKDINVLVSFPFDLPKLFFAEYNTCWASRSKCTLFRFMSTNGLRNISVIPINKALKLHKSSNFYNSKTRAVRINFLVNSGFPTKSMKKAPRIGTPVI